LTRSNTVRYTANNGKVRAPVVRVTHENDRIVACIHVGRSDLCGAVQDLETIGEHMVPLNVAA